MSFSGDSWGSVSIYGSTVVLGSVVVVASSVVAVAVVEGVALLDVVVVVPAEESASVRQPAVIEAAPATWRRTRRRFIRRLPDAGLDVFWLEISGRN
jgi:hypothetical protein